jgi:hypothetical protein
LRGDVRSSIEQGVTRTCRDITKVHFGRGSYHRAHVLGDKMLLAGDLRHSTRFTWDEHECAL